MSLPVMSRESLTGNHFSENRNETLRVRDELVNPTRVVQWRKSGRKRIAQDGHLKRRLK
jgi:hypothetical protein